MRWLSTCVEQLKPDFLFCDRELLPRNDENIWRGSWQWAIYNLDDVNSAIEMANRGMPFLETNQIGTLMSNDALANRINTKVVTMMYFFKISFFVTLLVLLSACVSTLPVERSAPQMPAFNHSLFKTASIIDRDEITRLTESQKQAFYDFFNDPKFYLTDEHVRVATYIGILHGINYGNCSARRYKHKVPIA